MAEAKKNTIARNLEGELRKALKGSGFFTDLGRNVTRRRQVAAMIPESQLPKAIVFFGEEEETTLGGCAGNHVSEALVGVQVVGKHAEIDAHLIDLEADAKRAVLSDPGRGTTGGKSNAKNTEFLGSKTDYQEWVDTQRGIVTLTFRVTYEWSQPSP